ncbi:aldehyde dehydrogenase family protein [Poriferisphaera sp. WC338]|uniref:aldehyde dehydrogenase family protein n=1 Tax=Poriferisphaera sp. WC338 TaxID=3425129 RepID=UPI003D81C2D7
MIRPQFPDHQPPSPERPVGAIVATAKKSRPQFAQLDVPYEDFENHPMRDFTIAEHRDAFETAIRIYNQIPDVSFIEPVDLEPMIDAANQSFIGWQNTAVYERAACLLRAADLMDQDRDTLAAIIIREAGKTWREADADVCEAIDFARFYARAAIDLTPHKDLLSPPGEHNQAWLEPRGLTAVISPWNFPLAITAGMTFAALVTGNPVILKPAEQTSYIAKKLVDILYESAVPKDVLHFAPGLGETIGAALVRHPDITTIAFTGSKEVGLDIIAAAAQTPPHQRFVKRVVCEMGGKNAIIIDDSADLDQAVIGVRNAAFSFAGQKCSACSRCIVLNDIYDTFTNRLLDATRALIVGDPASPATDVGPVIDQAAANKINHYIHTGKAEGTLALNMCAPPNIAAKIGKPIIGPHIFTDIQPDHTLANDEIFGPVLSIIHADNFQHAIDIANSTPFKLTGGIYSRKPSNLQLARQQFRVGNLYLNRPITGALVARQPFGGFGLSGVGEKAGGSQYLRQFTVPRVCTENTARRGFAPELAD